MEGLNQRRDRCPGDYSYNRVHKLAYIPTMTADLVISSNKDNVCRRLLLCPGQSTPRSMAGAIF